MKITTQFQLLVGGLTGGLLLACAAAVWQSSITQAANEAAYKGETVATAALADANSTLWSMRWGVAQYLALTDEADRARLLEGDKKNYARFDADLQAFLAQPVAPEVRAAAAEVQANYRKYADARAKWLEMMNAGDTAGAAAFRAQALTPAGGATVAAIGRLVELQKKTAGDNYQARNARLGLLSSAMLAACLLAAVAAAAFSWLLLRALGRQLGGEPADAAELARAVARGDLSVDIRVRPGDTSSLMAQLREMQTSLAGLVSAVRRGSEGVASASAEIAQGNGDLSGRTERQASALQQTAASMQQLDATVRQNSGNAASANELARGASQVAVRGGEVVSRVVGTMKDITDSSRKISEITGVIDTIAFQTNILALNAAVEAARAGEQGRGFAVVASEVRSLAQRSAEAAREIKALITASTERVEQGTALVDQAGTTMNEVVGAIQRVADIVGAISNASAEQSSGVTQVGQVIREMDEATQQNAALVEQSAAAADSLRQQAEQLVSAVAVFKLERGAVPA
jgi:methyl-accepting chemotaxis protein